MEGAGTRARCEIEKSKGCHLLSSQWQYFRPYLFLNRLLFSYKGVEDWAESSFFFFFPIRMSRSRGQKEDFHQYLFRSLDFLNLQKPVELDDPSLPSSVLIPKEGRVTNFPLPCPSFRLLEAWCPESDCGISNSCLPYPFLVFFEQLHQAGFQWERHNTLKAQSRTIWWEIHKGTDIKV